MKRYRVILAGFVLVSTLLVVFLILKNAKNYKEDPSFPVMAKKAEQISMRDSRKMQKTSLYATKSGLFTPIRSKSQILYYGYHGEKKRQTLKIYGEKIEIGAFGAFFASAKYLYVSGMDSGDEVEVLWKIPLSNGKVSTKKCAELVEGDDWSRMEIILATEKHFILNDGMTISRYDSDTGGMTHFFPDLEEAGNGYYEWIPVRNGAGSTLQKENYFFLKKKDTDGNVTFYKVNTDNLQKEKLDHHVISIYQDFNDEIYYFMSDVKGNYAYNPETGKKYGVGRNYQKEFKEGEAAGAFDFYMDDYNGDYNNTYRGEGRDDFREDYSCYNRDLAAWLHQKNPWDYQNREGGFTMENLFVYQGRMYVNAKVIWKDAKEVEKDENGYMGTEGNLLFSYDLKNYSGIREETQINKIMSQYSKRIRYSKDEDGKYNILETGEFPYQLQNILILRSLRTPQSEEKENPEQYSYVFYDLDTGKYKPIDEKSREFYYLYYAGVNEYESDSIKKG